jgi:hypothetical protein
MTEQTGGNKTDNSATSSAAAGNGRAGSTSKRVPGRGARQDQMPALADQPVLERLDGPPTAAPPQNESPHDTMRRTLITEPGQWVVLATRTKLTEALARRMARSYQRAKPARLVPTATGRFTARPFNRDGIWLVAACYEPGH